LQQTDKEVPIVYAKLIVLHSKTISDFMLKGLILELHWISYSNTKLIIKLTSFLEKKEEEKHRFHPYQIIPKKI